MASGTTIHQWEFHGGDTQKWSFSHLGDGYYSIKSARSSSTPYYLGVINDSTNLDVDVVLRSGSLTNGMKWKVEKTANGAYKIIPKTGESKDYVLATTTSSAANGYKLIQGDYIDNNSYRDEWYIKTGNVYVEFSYDLGFVDTHQKSGESSSVTRTRIEQQIINEFFPYVAKAFAQQCGVYFITSSISNYTSDADKCPNEGISVHCECIDKTDCLLEYYHNPNKNNSSVGFSYGVHCKSFIRLRNNLITDIPGNTIRVTYSGHDLCFYSSDSHIYTIVGLSDYDNPIICINLTQKDKKRSILVLAHELSHTYGTEHHSPVTGQPCIMDEDNNLYEGNDPKDPSTYWCDNCIKTITKNKNKY